MKPEGATPRALSALGSSVHNNGNFMQIYPTSYGQSNDNISISSYYFHDRVRNFALILKLLILVFSTKIVFTIFLLSFKNRIFQGGAYKIPANFKVNFVTKIIIPW